jgi:hypothetical protein
MRIALAAISLLVLGACQVSKDEGNGTTSVTYHSDVAENAAADIGNTAKSIAGDIGNNVKEESGKLQNKIDNKDVKVNVNADVNTTDTSENKAK